VVNASGRFGPYENPGDLALVAVYFNAGRYHRLLDNYLQFAQTMRQSGMPLTTVELAFDDEPFDIPDGENVIRVRSRSILFQKERLINLAVERLDERYDKVAWIDADIFFDNKRWAIDAANALEDYAVVQLFNSAKWLPCDEQSADESSRCEPSFAAVYRGAPKAELSKEWSLHGHTGFGWAAHRSLLADFGLYDRCPVGGADHIMAHAFFGDCDKHDCVKEEFYGNKLQDQHFGKWADRMSAAVGGRMTGIDGTVFHRWHGNYINRHYGERTLSLAYLEFDPEGDLAINDDGALDWSTDDHRLSEYCRSYLTKTRNADSNNLEELQHAMFSSKHTRYELWEKVPNKQVVHRLRHVYRKFIPLGVRLTVQRSLVKLMDKYKQPRRGENE
jgi:hypothetical protein